MTIKARLRDFFWMLLGNKEKCPVCKSISICYASESPFISCGECGWVLREQYFKKEVRKK